ncbi:hypothetical protein BDY24DRAFT_416920 [Mrakia frigida]|uniref:ion transporter n=1 Tax=Mrakia frigida TaxID=29902 RepID=UPI003FCBF9A9
MAEPSSSRTSAFPGLPSSSSSHSLVAEEYELNSPPPPPHSAPLPPSRRPSQNRTHSHNARSRGFSIHSLSSHPNSLLFNDFGSSPVHRRSHLPNPKVNFTEEDDEGEDARMRRRSNNILSSLGAEDDSTWEIARSMKSSWRRKVFLLMEEPKSSEEAFMVHWSVTFLILFSALLTVISTLPGYHSVPVLARVLFGLDTTIVVLFTLEYFTRLIGHSDSRKQLFAHATSFLAVIDFLSVFPYYLEIMLHDDTSVMFRFSILRTFRLLRVFRAFRYSNTVILTIEVMRISIKLSQDALLALAFFIVMVMIVFSTLIYFAERGSWDDVLQTFVNADGDPTSFGSIPAAAWFVLVTITTVGYGEITPRSTLGRLVTIPLLVFGLLLIALPSFVLGRNFSSVWEAVRHSEFDQTNLFHLPGADPSTLSPSSPNSPRLSQENQNLLPLPTTTTNNNNLTASSSRKTSHEGGRAVSPSSLEAANNGNGGIGLRTLPMGSPVASTNLHGLRMDRRDPSGPSGERGESRDLSNLKLARNQEALSSQIDSLREVVEAQGRLVAQLLAALSENTNAKAGRRSEGDLFGDLGGEGKGGKGGSASEKRKGKERERDGDGDGDLA